MSSPSHNQRGLKSLGQLFSGLVLQASQVFSKSERQPKGTVLGEMLDSSHITTCDISKTPSEDVKLEIISTRLLCEQDLLDYPNPDDLHDIALGSYIRVALVGRPGVAFGGIIVENLTSGVALAAIANLDTKQECFKAVKVMRANILYISPPIKTEDKD